MRVPWATAAVAAPGAGSLQFRDRAGPAGAPLYPAPMHSRLLRGGRACNQWSGLRRLPAGSRHVRDRRCSIVNRVSYTRLFKETIMRLLSPVVSRC